MENWHECGELGSEMTDPVSEANGCANSLLIVTIPQQNLDNNSKPIHSSLMLYTDVKGVYLIFIY